MSFCVGVRRMTERMYARSYVWLLTTVCVIFFPCSCVASAGSFFTCVGDYDCQMIPGYYCYLKSNSCTPCTKCESWNRKNVSHRICSRGWQECGDCLPGYFEEILGNGKPRSWCTLNAEEPTSMKSSFVNEDSGGEFSVLNFLSGHHGLPIGFLLGALFFITVTMIYIEFKKKANNRGQRGNPQREDPPPYSCLPLPPALMDVESGTICQRERTNNTLCSLPQRERITRIVSSSVPARIIQVDEAACPLTDERSYSSSVTQGKEGLQQAVPFEAPNYEQPLNSPVFSDDDQTTSDAESRTDGESSSDWNSELHDEATMPSDWTPILVPVEEGQEEEGESSCSGEPSAKRRREEKSEEVDSSVANSDPSHKSLH